MLEGVERGVKQPVEIIGVEDITRQIAVQIEGRGEQLGEGVGGRGVRDTVIEEGHQSPKKAFNREYGAVHLGNLYL